MTEPVSLGYLGRVLLRHRILVVLCVVLGSAAAVGVSFLLPAVYTSTATQLVKGLPGTSSTANYEAAQYAANRAKSYPSLIYSTVVLEGVRADLGKRQTIDDLRKDLSAVNPTDTPLVEISAEGSTAQEAQDKANSAARHLARFVTQVETVGGKSPIGVETPVEAALPIEPTSPRQKLMAAVGAVAGLAIAALIALGLTARETNQGAPPVRRDSGVGPLGRSESPGPEHLAQTAAYATREPSRNTASTPPVREADPRNRPVTRRSRAAAVATATWFAAATITSLARNAIRARAR